LLPLNIFPCQHIFKTHRQYFQNQKNKSSKNTTKLNNVPVLFIA